MKIDKRSDVEYFIRKKLEFRNEDVLFYSALTGYGKSELLEFVGEVVNEEIEYYHPTEISFTNKK